MAGFERGTAMCAMKCAASHRRRIKFHSITHADLVHGAVSGVDARISRASGFEHCATLPPAGDAYRCAGRAADAAAVQAPPCSIERVNAASAPLLPVGATPAATLC